MWGGKAVIVANFRAKAQHGDKLTLIIVSNMWSTHFFWPLANSQLTLSISKIWCTLLYQYVNCITPLPVAGLGICSFAHRSFAHLLILLKSNENNSLRSLKTNERQWANCSGRSEEMSNHEQIAQVTQDKWATMSDWLRSLRGNERMNDPSKNVG